MKTILGINQEEIKTLGHSLRRIETSSQNSQVPQSKKSIWYQGHEAYLDLFLIFCGEDIQWLQFTLRGKALTCERDCQNAQQYNWYVGTTNEGEIQCRSFPATSLIYYHPVQHSDFPHLVHAILQTRAGEKEFDKMLELFKNSELIANG